MDKKIKSGKEVIDEFFSEIYNIENVDKKTVNSLISLYNEGKFTDKNIQNRIDELLQEELTPKQKKDE